MFDGIKTMRFNCASKVLIYRLGSIGDTLVALPAFRFIAKHFKGAERRLLTSHPNSEKVAPADTILGPIDLVHGYFKYPLKTRNPQTLYRLTCDIRRWGPQAAVYLVQPRSRLSVLRDALFLKSCGISELIGMPWFQDQRQCRILDAQGFRESEAARLLRCLRDLGNGAPKDPSGWNLDLTEAERQKAEEVINQWPAKNAFICASIGAKAWIKDWGRDNWALLLRIWSARHPKVGLVMVGSLDEYDLSQGLAEAWSGQTINLCGKLAPRETAAVMKKAVLFVGHDSGPMHLAASVGKPCVAIFSSRNYPGEWYPFGTHHRILYHQTSCSGCRLTQKCNHNKDCIRSIDIEEVVNAMEELWEQEKRY